MFSAKEKGPEPPLFHHTRSIASIMLTVPTPIVTTRKPTESIVTTMVENPKCTAAINRPPVTKATNRVAIIARVILIVLFMITFLNRWLVSYCREKIVAL